MNNDEIKEILDYLQENSKKDEATKQLVGYITNLQQENKELNKENEKWYAVAKDFEMEAHDLWNKNNELEQENERLKEREKELSYHLCLYSSEETLLKQIEDYKSRTEKAVEYIQNHQLVFELSSKKVISQWFDIFYKDTLNILNGRSDE